MKMNWFEFNSACTAEQAEEQILAGITPQSRPSMMENKLEEGGVLYGNSENGIFWLQKKSEKGGMLPQRMFQGQVITREGKTVIGGRFAFVGGFHLMWFIFMVVAAVAIFVMFQNLAVTIVTAALFALCWFVASFCAPRSYKEEEQQVVEYLQSLFPLIEEEETEEVGEETAEETAE